MSDCLTWNVAFTASGFVVAIFFGWLVLPAGAFASLPPLPQLPVTQTQRGTSA